MFGNTGASVSRCSFWLAKPKAWGARDLDLGAKVQGSEAQVSGSGLQGKRPPHVDRNSILVELQKGTQSPSDVIVRARRCMVTVLRGL